MVVALLGLLGFGLIGIGVGGAGIGILDGNRIGTAEKVRRLLIKLGELFAQVKRVTHLVGPQHSSHLYYIDKIC